MAITPPPPHIYASTPRDYASDPYSAALNDIMRATQRAFANSGCMNETEYEILKSIQDTAARA